MDNTVETELEWNITVGGVDLGQSTTAARFDVINKAVADGRITAEMAKQETNFRVIGFKIIKPENT